MNQIRAFVHDIKSVENLNIVSFDANYHALTMMSLDLAKGLKKGVEVILSAKATSVAIAKNISGDLSYSNQLKVTIKAINRGKLLTLLVLEFDGLLLESIITTASHQRMELKVNDEVVALIKSSDLSIQRIV